MQLSEQYVPINGLRAAVYVRKGRSAFTRATGPIQTQLEVCRRYCTEHGYQLREQHIYQGDKEPFWSDAPRLVRLRAAALQKQFDVLVVPSPETLGIAWPEPWRFLSASVAIAGFYKHQVLIESVVERYGFHDVYLQMLKAALDFVTLTFQEEKPQQEKQQ